MAKTVSNLCAILITILSFNTFYTVSIIILSSFLSTYAVASSKTITSQFLSNARTTQTNYLYPEDKLSPEPIISISNYPG